MEKHGNVYVIAVFKNLINMFFVTTVMLITDVT